MHQSVNSQQFNYRMNLSITVRRIPKHTTARITQATQAPPRQQTLFMRFASSSECPMDEAAFTDSPGGREPFLSPLRTGKGSGVPFSPSTSGRGLAIGGSKWAGMPNGAPGAGGPMIVEPAILLRSPGIFLPGSVP